MSGIPWDECYEPMDVDVQDKDEGVLLTLSLKWSQSAQLQKLKPRLEKLLQTWFNKRKNKMDCSVESIRKDGSALIKVKPSPALSDLQELNGKTLTSKVGQTVTVLSISLAPPNMDSQRSDDESVNNSSSVPGPQVDEKQSDPVRKDIDPQGKNSLEEHKKPSEDCLVSVGHYWYVNHIYKEEIQRILKRNKVQIKANVGVEFEADQEDGSPEEALVDFTKLVQNSLSESLGTVFPLKFVDPDQWSDAMRAIQQKESKLLVTLSGEEVTVCGLSQSQNTFSAALNAVQKRNPSLREHKPALQDTSPKINMTIKDPLVDAGLTMKESHWKLMKTVYAKELTKIKEKFGVTFRESNFSQDKIDVKASYLGPGGNASLESHAVRALLHLHQKTATSPLSLTQPVGATELSGPVDKSSIGHWSEETSSGPPFNGESTYQYTKLGRQSSAHSTPRNTSFDEYKKPSEDCLVSVGHYSYVKHIYKEEIQCILKKNRVSIEATVNVKFKADQEDGSPQEALSKFTKLVQSTSSESSGSVIPLKFVDPDQWSDTMRVIQKNKSKLLLNLSCEEVIVCGPSQSQDAFSAALNAMQKRNPSLREHKPALQDTSPKINMTIKDSLVDAGLTMNESHRKLMNTAYAEKLTKIKEKFGVTFRESNLSQDKIDVKASYLGPGGNASLESHAARAFLYLHQKTATSPLSLTQPVGATGLSGPVDKFSTGHWSEETSGGPPFNGESTHQYTKAPANEGASAGDIEDDKCPICLSTFTNKKQLKCKHEFCNDCLQNAEKHGGPICPVCKDVFGLIEGDQPDGKMTWTTHSFPLPGFQNCGHIIITYDIPDGVQTGKHPNPGQRYFGTRRVAYLPDNKEGKEVLRLLKKAFDQKLIFTVGTSRTTGAENQVTWNDIQHKTSMMGGPQCFGYPDPDYLKRVKEELKDKGIK